MGGIIKFQHEVYNGKLGTDGKPDIDILYPKTSADMVEGLPALITSLLQDTKVTAVTIVAGTATARPKIKITLSDGTNIESGEITLAALTAYGVTKLSSTIDTSETLAATPKAVKTAYDLANSANSTASTANTNAQTAISKANQIITVLNSQLLRVVVISNVSVDAKKTTTIDLSSFGVNATNIVDAIAFNGDKSSLMAIVRDGVSFAIKDTTLHISTTATMVITVKVLYNYSFSIT